MSDLKLISWLKSGCHLPVFMRDFHAQKEVFKAMHIKQEPSPEPYNISWMSMQINVIDGFLWFMAKRGYTLQKCRAKQRFYDIGDDIDDLNSALSSLCLDDK